MTKTYDSTDVKNNKKGWYLTTDVTTEQENINLLNFIPENLHGVTIVANSTNADATSENINKISSTAFNDTITAKNGAYEIYLNGHGNKKVTTGKYDDTLYITTTGKNTVNLGDGINTIKITENGSKNTITTGKYKDIYDIDSGINKITDKGGHNIFDIAESTNTINILGSGNDNFTLGHNSTNNISATKGGDKNFVLQYNSNSTIKTGAGSDTFNVNLYNGGYANIKSGGGIDYLNLITNGMPATFDKVVADLGNGNDVVNITKEYVGSISRTLADIKTGNGEDTVNIFTGLSNKIDTGKDTDNIFIHGGTNNYISTGDAKDFVHIFAEATTEGTTSTIKTGKGNDGIDIKGGINYIYAGAGKDEIIIQDGSNTVNGEAGKDTVKISGGINTVYGGSDIITISGGTNTINANSDTINISAGDNTLNLKKGKSTINIETSSLETTINSSIKNQVINLINGSSNTINGGDAAEIYNIKNGSGNKINGGAGNDTFNITGGSLLEINGGAGNDIYNLTSSEQYSFIYDNEGVNTYNIKKDYSGRMQIINGSNKDKLVFDKSYKLSNASNVSDDVITTNGSTVTLYCNYTSSSDSFGGDKSFIFDMGNEISDKNLNNNIVKIYSDNYSYSIGAKNYTLDLNSLKQDLAAWFTDHSTYADSSAVFSGGDTNDINSLMAVYTKDTASCFVKA